MNRLRVLARWIGDQIYEWLITMDQAGRPADSEDKPPGRR